MAPRIFLTGASGYIGGDVLHALLSTHPDWESSITLLLRNRAYEAAFKSAYPSINLFFVSLDDTAAIADEVSKHEFVVHFAASADHLPSAQAIVAGLKKRGDGVYIHTSGTDVLLDPREELHPTGQVRVIDDWDGIGVVTSLPDDAPHRNVDKFVLASGSDTLKTAIICPSTVYGGGRGLISQRSDQIPNLAKLILQQKQGVQLADGRTFWNSVHVYDLSQLYVRVLDDAIGARSESGSGLGRGFARGLTTWNRDGYYLVESGWYFWGEIAQLITSEAYKLGLLPSDEVVVVARRVLAPAGRPVVNSAVKAKTVRARRLLGWAAVEGSLQDEIPAIVRAEASALGLKVQEKRR